MNSSQALSRQGRRLLQLGVGLFLFASLEGFAIPYLAAPHLGLATHRLSALVGVALIAFGLLWPQLSLGPAAARLAFWTHAYSALAIVAAYLLAALLGAGNTIISQAAGDSRGTDFQEAAIKIIAYSSAPTGILSFALVLWGLRGAGDGEKL